jgi:hypothetical protein
VAAGARVKEEDVEKGNKAARYIWTTRNDWIFKGLHPNEASCRSVFVKELNLVSFRVKPSALDRFELWMQNIQNI